MTLQNMYITAIHRPWRKHRGRICRFKTFWMRIFERTTFLLLRCCSIHGKLCVLATYSATIELKVVAQTMHSGITHERSADFRHGKKKQKRGEFITPPRPTGRRSNNLAKLILTTRGFSGKSSIQGKHTGKYIWMKKILDKLYLS